MKISDKFASKKLVASIEIFPPKTEQGLLKIFELLKQFVKYNPAYVSVTYGAGGSTRDRTIDVVKYIRNEFNYDVMPHFTCVGHNKAEIDEIIRIYEFLQIKNILALRGDPPIGSEKFVAQKDGFQYASELIAYLKNKFNFDIGGAGFPEGHVQSENLESDRKFLKHKIDTGANFIITQFFFCNKSFLSWRDGMRDLGATVPLIPGIWLPSNAETTIKFSKTNNVKIPVAISDIYEKYPEGIDRTRACQDFTRNQVAELIKEGVPGLHVYSFNQELPVETLSDYFNYNKV